MIAEGQIVLFQFPQADNPTGKLRPALVIRRIPGRYEDWLICMISAQVSQEISGFDQLIGTDDQDFQDSGLKMPSLIRTGRLAVVNAATLLGKIGRISDLRLAKIKESLSKWILDDKETVTI